jgi:hypothetical protein
VSLLQFNSIIFITKFVFFSKKAHEIWEEIGGKYEDDDRLVIADFNCDDIPNKMICRKFKVFDYPQFIMFKNGRKDEKYADKRNVKHLSLYIEEYLADTH